MTGRAKKMKRNEQASSLNRMRKNNAQTMISGRGQSTKMSWKMDDIFLGFEDADDGTVDDDKKTVKINQLSSPKRPRAESQEYISGTLRDDDSYKPHKKLYPKKEVLQI